MQEQQIDVVYDKHKVGQIVKEGLVKTGIRKELRASYIASIKDANVEQGFRGLTIGPEPR